MPPAVKPKRPQRPSVSSSSYQKTESFNQNGVQIQAHPKENHFVKMNIDEFREQFFSDSDYQVFQSIRSKSIKNVNGTPNSTNATVSIETHNVETNSKVGFLFYFKRLMAYFNFKHTTSLNTESKENQSNRHQKEKDNLSEAVNEENIITTFDGFIKQFSVLNYLTYQPGSMEDNTNQKIIHHLTNLKNDSLGLINLNQIELKQEVQSLTFHVLPHIISVYTESLQTYQIDKQGLSDKLETGLAELAQSIHLLKEKHVSLEHYSSEQALDGALQFARSRFSSTSDTSLDLPSELEQENNSKKMKMKG